MTRKQLERAAVENVCSCWAWGLINDMEYINDETLQEIIKDSQYLHKQEQRENPIPTNEYEEELRQCPSAK
jgi:hypothetical protein